MTRSSLLDSSLTSIWEYKTHRQFHKELLLAKALNETRYVPESTFWSISRGHCLSNVGMASSKPFSTVVTCEIKSSWNNFKIISMFLSHVTTSETEIKLFQLLKEFWNYIKITSAILIEYAAKCLWAAIIFWNNFKIISGKFPRAETKLFQTDVDEGWNNCEIILFHM